jgi:hypothetical protein
MAADRFNNANAKIIEGGIVLPDTGKFNTAR